MTGAAEDLGDHDRRLSEPPRNAAAPASGGLVADPAMLVRGLGLACLAAGALWGALLALTKGGWLLVPLSGLLALSGAFAAWAAIIHFTGGEKFDDHPLV